MSPSRTADSSDTIAAIATPFGRGAVSIVRLSGRHSKKLVSACLLKSKEWDVRRPFLSSFADASGNIIDQVLITWFQSPGSYTGEDVIEISCHGSPIIAHQILESVRVAGARLAEPGEFTYRAFLNGKLDLSQAEAVRDLIESRTAYHARVATQQLCGHLSKTLDPLKSTLVEVICNLETTLEFVEDEVAPKSREDSLGQLAEVIDGVQRLEESYRFGRRVESGMLLVIVGRPNVGKSSLFNCLVKKDRVIVAALPGTTRDTVEEMIDLGGIATRLVDTAGIRDTMDEVESFGVQRSRDRLEEADLVLMVVDQSEGWTPEDEAVWSALETAVPVLLVLNKADQPKGPDLPAHLASRVSNVVVSALESRGIEALESAIVRLATGEEVSQRESWVLLNARHHECLVEADRELSSGVNALREGLSEEFSLYHLRKGLDALGAVTGETTVEDLLSQIFSTFCIGK